MRPARLLPGALLLLLLWGGGAVSWWATPFVGLVWAIIGYWAYLLLLAVWVLGLGICMPHRLRAWWQRAAGNDH